MLHARDLEAHMYNGDGIKAMVLAAGVGSRLDPLTRQLPKPLVPFVNQPVMQHIINLLKRHGISETISNLHYLPEKIISYFGTGSDMGIPMSFVTEPELTGDAGGVRACKDKLKGGTFLVAMGDLITDLDISYIIKQHKEKGALATVALKQVADVERFGIAVVGADNMIREFEEKPSRGAARSNLASTGLYVFEPEIFDYIPETGVVGFGKDVFPRLLADKLPFLGVEVWGYWSDIGTIEQYKRSTFDALEGLIDLEIPGESFKNGWRDESATIGQNVLIDGLVLIGKDCYIGRDVRLEGRVVIGDNCVVQSGAFLRDSIIWPGTIIGAGSTVIDSIIGGNCSIPARSRLNAAATIEPSRPIESPNLPAELSGDTYALDELPQLAGFADERELDAERF